jgi:CheY-like chemotaxis protein
VANAERWGHIVKSTVLYVEDNVANIRLVERILQLRPDVSLLVATTGQAGLQVATESLPTLILLDRRLPDMLGDEVIVKLKASTLTAAIPIVVFSGDSRSSEIAAVLDIGADEFLPKPFDLDDFLHMVDRFCAPPGDRE